MRYHLKIIPILALAVGMRLIEGCVKRTKVVSYQGESNRIAAVIQKRHLTPADVLGAVSTFVPNGRHDPFIMLASGGQSGQVLVDGIP